MHYQLLLPFLLACAALHAGEQSASPTILIDGSSTVYPMTVVIGERYAAQNPHAGMEVLCSGSTAGFRRLIAGEVPISGASRPIKPDELAKATKAGIEVIELPIAYDGLTLVMNKNNTFIDHLTLAELKKIWEPDSQVRSWKQVRATFPDLPISLWGPGKDSGTFDFFTEVIVGTARASRSDFTASEDDNDLVQGVVRNKGALGYFGMAYFHENEAVLKAVPVDSGNGAVMPSPETVANGTYRPLSRPLFLYVNKAALVRNEVRLFLEAYLKMVSSIAPQIGYVPLEQRTYELVSARLAVGTTGSIFTNARQGARIDELLMAQAVAKAPAAAKEPVRTQPAQSAKATPSDTTISVPVPTATSTVSPVASDAKPVTAAGNTTAKELAPTASAVATKPPAPTPKATAAASIPTTAVGAPAPNVTIQGRRLDHLRDRAISLARLTLDEPLNLDEIQARIEELRQITAGVDQARTNAPTLPEDQAGYLALIDRLQLTSDGRTLMDDGAFTRLKKSLASITDGELRRVLALALLQPGPEHLPRFTAAVSNANGGQADVDAVLCYARGGFSLR
jgi:phosphate transport system substrate-binding protein